MNRLFRTTVVEISGVRTIAGGGTNASNATQALLNLSGVSLIGNQTISGNINISGAFTTSRSKNFIYSGERRGPASRDSITLQWNNIAYGANCTITPQYKGTIKAEASVGLTTPFTTADTLQAATFWYGTGTPPVFSGNLNDLNNITRIGGIKGIPQQSATSANVQISPIGASWVAEITGLTTGTSYWFDVAMSGRFLYVQDVQIYLEEKY